MGKLKAPLGVWDKLDKMLKYNQEHHLNYCWVGKQVQHDFVFFSAGAIYPVSCVVKTLKKQVGNRKAEKILFRPIYTDYQIVRWVTVLPIVKYMKTS